MTLKQEIKDLIKNESEKGWSDLHISEGKPLRYRNKSGHLVKLEKNKVTKEDIFDIVKNAFILMGQHHDSLDAIMNSKSNDFDFSVAIEMDDGEVVRFRTNMYYANERKVHLVMRRINDNVIPLEKLDLPKSAQKFLEHSSGLILVTGPTGSGKSTTLASMIDEINRLNPFNIITVEDPVEFRFEEKESIISQREVGGGKDIEDFKAALRSAVREDPNVILVGEIRDAETAMMCLSAAQTGHLVFGTLHTNDSAGTINRYIQLFESGLQNAVRDILGEVLIGVISQVLVPMKKSGKAMACEVLVVDQSIRSYIKDATKQNQIKNGLTIGQSETGMVTLNQSLLQLVLDGKVEPHVAKGYSRDKDELSKMFLKNNIDESPLNKTSLNTLHNETHIHEHEKKTKKGFLNNF